MDSHFFRNQISRLEDNFGCNHFKQERIKIIWREVQYQSNEWMIKTVDYFIGAMRLAPLLSDFQEKISEEREHKWKQEKKIHQQEAKEFSTSLSQGEIGMICKSIRDMIQGNLKDSEKSAFLKTLSTLAIPDPLVKKMSALAATGQEL